MPFTPAHSALVLPLIKTDPRFVSATGLIIGSLAPDFEYFLKMSVRGTHGHTIPGIFYFDVPVTIFLAIVFHLVVKKNLIENLPQFFRSRFALLSAFDFINYFKKYPAIFVISAIIGAASHIFWDGFTHLDGFFVRQLPAVYDGTVLPFMGIDYPLWYALQHISTGIGLAIVLLYISYMKPYNIDRPHKISFRYWMLLKIVTLGIVGLRFLIYSDDYNFGNLVVTFISGLCVALIVCGLLPARTKSTDRIG